MPSRGKVLSAAPNSLCVGTRLLSEPSTVRNPKGKVTFAIRSIRGVPAAFASAIWI